MSLSEKLATKLIDFIYDEAELLDQAQYEQWLDLFSDDGLYWIPSEPEQKSPYSCTSHLFDDKLMRSLRVERLSGARAYSQQPRSRSHHLLQRPRIRAAEGSDNLYLAETKFSYTEFSEDESQTYVGVLVHHLVVDGEAVKIKLKRVNLLNCDAPLPAVQLFI
ncbi:MAG: aromatic-ring-hydroxylating dioxygenase subunit beta [Pigmentiphaga sp.]